MSLRERIEDVVAAIILQARAGEHDVGVAKPSVARATDAVMAVIEAGAWVWDADDAWNREQYMEEGKWLVIPWRNHDVLH